MGSLEAVAQFLVHLALDGPPSNWDEYKAKMIMPSSATIRIQVESALAHKFPSALTAPTRMVRPQDMGSGQANRRSSFGLALLDRA